MARPLRIEYEGAIYHITARGNERKKIECPLELGPVPVGCRFVI
jgi:hypothetical protein